MCNNMEQQSSSAKQPVYQAAKTRSNRPGWSIIFKHPKRNDSRGRPGLKVRRGLGTTDETEATKLVDQLNSILSDQRWWSADRRAEAAREFAPPVVAAFYDGLEMGKISPIAIRDSKIPLPTTDDGYARVILAGTTGAGKTTLLRHLIGANHKKDRFPSTSTSKTTTAEIEIITAEGNFDAVVTFMPEHEVRAHIDECIEDACLEAIRGSSDSKICSCLLTHREQRFRLSYVLGNLEVEKDEDDSFDFEDESDTEEVDSLETLNDDERRRNRENLAELLARIRALSIQVGAEVAKELDPLEKQESPDDRATWLELFGDSLYEDEEFSRIALDIKDLIEDRFALVDSGSFDRGPTGWPVMWTFEAGSREQFLRQIRWFSSNHHQQFGRLLTPLVDGLRVRGPLLPAHLDLQVAPKLVIIDGEGIGHTAKAASSISTKVTRRFSDVDVILVVDNAEQPMQSAPLELLRAIGNSGHAGKLALAFTHFDQVKGANLGSHRLRQEHVMDSVRNAINSLRQAVGAPVAAMLEEQIESNSFFLGALNKEMRRIPSGVVSQLKRLLEVLQASAKPANPVEIAPVYSPEGLETALRDAVEGFLEPWRARLGLAYRDGVEKEHWTRIKALARRFANAWSNEYDSMRPVADLVSRLQENISKWLDNPTDWTGSPSDQEERNAALSGIRSTVFSALHELAENRISESHRLDWSTAFDFSGARSSFRRADTIERIYEEAAPIINSAMTQPAREFLSALHQIVRASVEEAGGKFQSGSS